MTHDELVIRAAKWLKNTKKLAIVICEAGAWREIPDAIGWDYLGHSTSVECKVSLADYRADSRKGDKRLGSERYYLMPPGLIDAERVREGWGLLYAHESRIEVVKQAPCCHLDNGFLDCALLIAEFRRVLGGYRGSHSKVGIQIEPPDSLDGFREFVRARDDRLRRVRRAELAKENT